MKNHYNLTRSCFLALLVLVSVFTSCQKSIRNQTFDDVFDTSQIQSLNLSVENAQTLDDLPAEFADGSMDVPTGLEEFTAADMISYLEKNLTLSNTEISLLLKNDSKTYLEVIDRICSLPPQVAALNYDFSNVKKSSMSKYVLLQKENLENFYSNDYYSAIKELQNYMKTSIIRPLNNMQTLVNNSNTLKSAQMKPKPKPFVEFVLITSNNIWDMWWHYTTDGKRTKHKGAAGSFPG